MTDVLAQGRNLALAARTIAASDRELTALLDTLWEMLQSEEAHLGRCQEAKPERSWKENWVYGTYGYNAAFYEVVQRQPGQRGALRAPKLRGTLSLLVRLCGDPDCDTAGYSWPWLDQACLLVGWHGFDAYWCARDFDATPGNQECLSDLGHGLWCWTEDGENHAVFFALPLFALRREADLRAFVLAPLRALFLASAPEQLSAKAFQGVPVLKG
jgi:hypothetical protein